MSSRSALQWVASLQSSRFALQSLPRGLRSFSEEKDLKNPKRLFCRFAQKVIVNGSSPMNQVFTQVLHTNLCLVCCFTRFTALFAASRDLRFCLLNKITGEPKILPFLFVVIRHTERLTRHRFLHITRVNTRFIGLEPLTTTFCAKRQKSLFRFLRPFSSEKGLRPPEALKAKPSTLLGLFDIDRVGDIAAEGVVDD